MGFVKKQMPEGKVASARFPTSKGAEEARSGFGKNPATICVTIVAHGLKKLAELNPYGRKHLGMRNLLSPRKNSFASVVLCKKERHRQVGNRRWPGASSVEEEALASHALRRL